MQRLYKYTSLVNLFDLLLNNRLYFHPVHMFEDGWEGVPLPSDLDRIGDHYKQLLENAPPGVRNHINIEQILRLGALLGCVSCWHSADRESMAMWKIYAGEGKGVCLVVDKDRLISASEAAAATALQRGSSFGMFLLHFPINYVDRATYFSLPEDQIPRLSHAAEYKDLAYEYEREYRLWICGPIANKNSSPDPTKWFPVIDEEATTLWKGLYQTIDWDFLESEIIISPFFQSHEQQAIEKAVRCCSSSIPIRTSSLPIGKPRRTPVHFADELEKKIAEKLSGSIPQ